MEYLPDEVLIMIFDYLPSHILCGTVSRVCRRWDYLSSRRVALVRCPDTFRRWCQGKGVKALFLMIQDPLLPSSLPFLPSAAFLTQLTIHLCLPLGSRDLILLSQLRLQHVDVFCKAEILSDAAVPLASRVSSFVLNEPVAPGFLRAVAKRAQLKAFHMYGRAGNYPREEMNELLDSHCHRFEELTLRCPNLREADYAAIGRCASLYSLKLYCCWEITPPAAMHLTRLQNLRKLHLTGTKKHLDSRSLLRVIHNLPQGLVELALSASRLGDEHASALGNRVLRLRVLELWRTLLTPAGLLRLVRPLLELQELDLDMSLNRRQLLQLQRHPSLHTVRCQLPQVKIPTYPYFDLLPNYAAIGRCASLYSLKLYCCWEITPPAAMHLTRLQNLRKLHLTGTKKHLDSRSLLRVIHNLPQGLVELALSASRLGDEHASALGNRVLRLRVLELWRTLLTPAGLLRLVRPLLELQELDLDMSLNRRQLLQLQRHPSLHTVRCQLPQEKFETRLRLLTAEESPSEPITGLGGAREGGRARLLYYWAQDLPPLHSAPSLSSPTSPNDPPKHMLQF